MFENLKYESTGSSAAEVLQQVIKVRACIANSFSVSNKIFLTLLQILLISVIAISTYSVNLFQAP